MGVFFFSLAAALLASAVAREADSKPNIILILTDDQGYQDLGCYDWIAAPSLKDRPTPAPRTDYFYYAACRLLGVRDPEWRLVLPRPAKPSHNG